jgi:hypothetical protein
VQQPRSENKQKMPKHATQGRHCSTCPCCRSLTCLEFGSINGSSPLPSPTHLVLPLLTPTHPSPSLPHHLPPLLMARVAAPPPPRPHAAPAAPPCCSRAGSKEEDLRESMTNGPHVLLC